MPSTVDDGGTTAMEVGVKFTADTGGYITGIRFYKASGNGGTHVGDLWTAGGSLLTTATFRGETASGWQQMDFATPVLISANTTYIASYHTNTGHTSDDHSYFTNSGVNNSPLHALQSGVSGGNGVYIDNAGMAFPTNTNQDSNYWVDVAFVPLLALTPANPTIAQGTTQQFTATETLSDGSTQNLTSSVTWSSTNTAAATITSAGLASGVAIGSTTIQATLGSISGSTTLTVSSAGLVGWWKFDEGSGTTAADSSGNGNTLTLVNGVSWVLGKIGDAISANGTNQYGTVPAFNLSGTSTVTVAFWANRTYSTTVESVLLEDSTNYNNSTTGFGFFPDDTLCNGIQTALRGNVGRSANCYNQPSSGAWHHLAVIYDKTQAGNNQTALYIDGVLQVPTSNLNTSQNTNSFGNNPIYLFSRDGSQYFNAGEMDDLRLYNRALSATEIQQLYQAGSASLVSIAVTPANSSIAKGTTRQFTATGTYSDSSTQNLTSSVTWTSTSTSVATVTGAGLATGVAQGSTTIQATSGSITGSTGLTVTPPVLVSIAVTPANPSIAKGTTQQFTATGTYSDSSTQNLTSSATWSSTNTAAATITSAGLATGVGTGTTTIQAALGSINGSTHLTVTAVLVSIAVTPANSSIAKGTTRQFTATGMFSDGGTLNLTGSVTWTSTSTSVATVTGAGLATGVAQGSTTIQATSGSISGSTKLTVTAPPPFAYRRAVTLTNSGPTLTSYQVKIALTSANMNFSHANSDGSDVRVRASDGVTNLPYWIENWDSSSQIATVWANVPSIPNGSSTIYLVYGQGSATTAASGTNTFLFFDDFSSADPIALNGYYQESALSAVNLGAAQTWEGGDWPHFFTVLPNPYGATLDGVKYTYWAWYGLHSPFHSGIGLAGSNDLVNWTKYSSNPVIPMATGASRPSVILDGTTLRMAYENTESSQQVGYATSTDGISWTIQTAFTTNANGGFTPHLWINPNDSKFYLFWSSGGWTFYVRSATSMALLLTAPDTAIWTAPNTLAYSAYAPHVTYDSASGLYVLQYEAQPNIPTVTDSNWDVTTLLSSSPTSGWYLAAGNPYRSGGNACPENYTFNGTIYTYYCHYTGSAWTIEYTTAAVSAGLQQYGKPKTSLWTDVHDTTDVAPAWYLKSCTDWKGISSTCLVGFARYSGANSKDSMLQSSYSGTNYILNGQVYGMESNNAQLGFRMGATSGDEYSTELYYDRNGSANFYITQKAPSVWNAVASVAAGNLFYNTWYQVEADTNSTTQAGSIENQTYSASGTETTYTSGRAGPSLKLYGTSMFGYVFIHQYASTIPTNSVGSETSGDY